MSSERNQTSSAKPPAGRVPWFSLVRLFGIGLFIFLLWGADRRALARHLQNVHWGWFGAALLLQAALLAAKSVRWHLLTAGTPAATSFVRCSGQYLESYALGVVTPGRVGEFMRVGHVVRAGGRALDTGLLVICERSMDFGMFVMAAGVALMLKSLPFYNPVLAALIITIGVTVLIGVSGLFSSRKMIDLFVRQLSATPLRRFRIFASHEPRSWWVTASALVLSAASALSHFLSCYFLAFGVGLETTFVQASGGLAAAGLLSALPITVMGMGTREVALLYVYQAQPQSLVLAFSALVLLAAQVGGGVVAMAAGQTALWVGRRKTESPALGSVV